MRKCQSLTAKKVRSDWISPMTKPKLLYSGTKKLPEIFSEKEINMIFQHIINSQDYLKSDWGQFMKWRDICLIASVYILGLRPLEACKLKFSDFNFRIMVVKIKGTNNKTGKDRIIPVPQILMKFYKEYFKLPRKRFWKGSKYLFPSAENNHISSGRLKHIFREKILKPLELWEMPQDSKLPKLRLYSLRHSRASHILKKQIKEHGQPDLYTIANFLGHADLRSTQVYLHTDKEYQDYLRGQIEI